MLPIYFSLGSSNVLLQRGSVTQLTLSRGCEAAPETRLVSVLHSVVFELAGEQGASHVASPKSLVNWCRNVKNYSHSGLHWPDDVTLGYLRCWLGLFKSRAVPVSGLPYIWGFASAHAPPPHPRQLSIVCPSLHLCRSDHGGDAWEEQNLAILMDVLQETNLAVLALNPTQINGVDENGKALGAGTAMRLPRPGP